MTIQRCRVCNAECNFFQEVKGIEREQNIIHSSFFHPKKEKMKIYKCPECTHLQIEDILSPDYYSVYDKNKGTSQYVGALDLFERKIKKLRDYSANNEKFLDIGCGTGHALVIAEKLFSKCVGVEPAENACKIAQAKGFAVINDYFNKSLNLENGFSAFSAFQVFEHLNDIYPVLNYAHEILGGGGGRSNKCSQRTKNRKSVFISSIHL
jgi:SAM-dependent methyltransferase